jgi:hypothetical protein
MPRKKKKPTTNKWLTWHILLGEQDEQALWTERAKMTNRLHAQKTTNNKTSGSPGIFWRAG